MYSPFEFYSDMAWFGGAGWDDKCSSISEWSLPIPYFNFFMMLVDLLQLNELRQEERKNIQLEEPAAAVT